MEYSEYYTWNILHTTEFRWNITEVKKGLSNITMDLATVEYHEIIITFKDNSIEYQLNEPIKGGIYAAKGYRRGQSVILVKTLKGLEIY